MDEYREATRRDDPVESGALEDEGEGELTGLPQHDEPTESGALEEEPSEAGSE